MAGEGDQGPVAVAAPAEEAVITPVVLAVPGRRRWPLRFHRPAHRARRSWPRRLLIGANILTAMCLLAAATFYGYVKWRYDQISSVDLPSLSPVRPAPAGAIGGPAETVLIVGSDVRAGRTPAEIKAFGSSSAVGGQRSDTIMLLRVDPSGQNASLLSVPRDLWVSIPGTNRRDRINATFDTGPDLLIRAVQQDLHVEINHYIEVDFASFRSIVNAIGGVNVWFPTAARDSFSGLNIAGAGCYRLNGDTALAYVRARHYQFFDHGHWNIEPESDLARIRRQQDFVRRVMRKTLNSSVDNPTQINAVVGAVVNNLTVDSALKAHPSELVRLARALRVLGADALHTATVPTVGTVIGGGDVLLLKQPEADQTLSAFANPAPATPAAPSTPAASTTTAPPVSVSPSSVRVRVLNGSGATGQATSASRALSALGFTVTGAGAADNYRYPTSVVRYPAGQEAAAQLLAGHIGGGATTQVDATLASDGPLVLVTGASYNGVTGAGATGGPVTATVSTPTTSATTSTTQPPPLPGEAVNPVPATCR
jgi:LCP family protein required for cell wall assembly